MLAMDGVSLGGQVRTAQSTVSVGSSALSVSTTRVVPRARAAQVWFGVLLASVCFEGLGRKYLPFVPSTVLYFAKDIVLLVGLAMFGIRPTQVRLSRALLGSFRLVVIAAFVWTFVEMLNPSQPSIILAVIGLRAYWLWWIAPLVIASALRRDVDRVAALKMLSATAMVVAVLAAFQFASPASAPINNYVRWEDSDPAEVATVGTTGRARVSSTFSFLTGFADFLIVAPALLLALGMAEEDRKLHWLILAATGLTLGVMPMAGSRGPLVIGGVALLIVAWRAGFLQTRAGRRIVIVAAIAVIGSTVLTPLALEGVRDRFQGADTQGRFEEAAQLFPPISLGINEYPLLGIGTGMQQNARVQFRIASEWLTEGEAGRLLVELGVVGYLLIWLTKVGLAVALVRAAKFLKTHGHGPMSGGALAFAFFAFIGNSVFDHIWQALFFLGVGMIFLAVERGLCEALEERQRSPQGGDRPRSTVALS